MECIIIFLFFFEWSWFLVELIILFVFIFGGILHIGLLTFLIAFDGPIKSLDRTSRQKGSPKVCYCKLSKFQDHKTEFGQWKSHYWNLVSCKFVPLALVKWESFDYKCLLINFPDNLKCRVCVNFWLNSLQMLNCN